MRIRSLRSFSLDLHKLNKIKIPLPPLIIDVPSGSNFIISLDVFSSCWINCLLSRGVFGSWGHALVAVAIVERWPLKRGLNKSKCVDCPLGQKKVPVVETVAVSGGSTTYYVLIEWLSCQFACHFNWLERCTGIAKVRVRQGSNPAMASLKLLQSQSFRNCITVAYVTVMISLHLITFQS